MVSQAVTDGETFGQRSEGGKRAGPVLSQWGRAFRMHGAAVTELLRLKCMDLCLRNYRKARMGRAEREKGSADEP